MGQGRQLVRAYLCISLPMASLGSVLSTFYSFLVLSTFYSFLVVLHWAGILLSHSQKTDKNTQTNMRTLVTKRADALTV